MRDMLASRTALSMVGLLMLLGATAGFAQGQGIHAT